MRTPALLCVCLLSAVVVRAQHLWWDGTGREQDVCLYGEITVLETSTGTYFCGANWHMGEPAAGYCGIQDAAEPDTRLTICMVWDTAEGLAPTVTYKMPGIKEVAGPFGGGATGVSTLTGASTLTDWPWKVGETFRFYARKRPGSAPDTTDLLYYAYDNAGKKWVHMSTITSPNGGRASARTLTNINSFLHNYLGQNRDAPRLALYRLWSGKDLDRLTPIRNATGDGTWGQLGGAYFIASGSKANLEAAYARWAKTYGAPRLPKPNRPLAPIPMRSLPAGTLEELKAL